MITPEERVFNILPVIAITKVKNPYTEEFKKDIPEANWRDYYIITIAWLKWGVLIQL